MLVGTVISMGAGRYCNKSFLIEGLFLDFLKNQFFSFFCEEKSPLGHYISIFEVANAHNCQIMYTMAVTRCFLCVIVNSN